LHGYSNGSRQADPATVARAARPTTPHIWRLCATGVGPRRDWCQASTRFAQQGPLANPLATSEKKGPSIAQAVVTDPTLISLPDDQVLARAAAAGRALVTANIKDFMPLDAQYRAAGQTHAGLILVSTKTFAQDRTYTTAITSALAALLDKPGQIQDGHVLSLTRH
jgi:hypothetical protein